MLTLPGTSCLSTSRRAALLSSIQAKCPDVSTVDGLYVHFVQCQSHEKEQELSVETSVYGKTLVELLQYGDDNTLGSTTAAFRGEAGARVVYVVPRPGTISPWSSKATDIAKLCNLSSHVERLERGFVYVLQMSDGKTITEADLDSFKYSLHDRMTQSIYLNSPPSESRLFAHHEPRPLISVSLQPPSSTSEDVESYARAKLTSANSTLGLSLSSSEISYLAHAFISTGRDPTDAELFMFAQVNSEHCRHKIFNASWTIHNGVGNVEGEKKEMSLFSMIRNTEWAIDGKGTMSAYKDNAAVMLGFSAPRFAALPTHTSSAGDSSSFSYIWTTQPSEPHPILIKVETHNHPTAISPFPGAATGSGGEIRDEGAVGRGSQPIAGLCGFTTSDLLIPGAKREWEVEDVGRPGHVASALDIMLEAPLGSSGFSNEFGRPGLAGYWRTFLMRVPTGDDKGEEVRGYHKPIMLAGGLGHVRSMYALKAEDAIRPGDKLVVLGGPGMLIGLGGGAASSRATGGGKDAELDFASVQRDNAEMQRRCQQVIFSCTALASEDNPIRSIHDVGAGGLSNALPELVHDCSLGARIDIRDVPVADAGMSPMEVWCNEAQERYVLAVAPGEEMSRFEEVCRRERAVWGVVGEATKEEELVVTDRLRSEEVVRMSMDTLFGRAPRMERVDKVRRLPLKDFDSSLLPYLPQSLNHRVALEEAARRVLLLPSVGSKSFLITIGDRSVTGLVARDQMVGPYQVPVADVGITRTTYGFDVKTGEAMALGERTPVALCSPAASARMAVGEALTNLSAAYIGGYIGLVKLSANWMCAASKSGEGAALYEAVQAVGMDLCPKLGIGIPVGKDSMSMSMRWKDEGSEEPKEVSSPLSLIVTAFSPVVDVESTWTPQLQIVDEETALVLVDISQGKTRMGGSALAQVFKQTGSECPDVDNAAVLKAFLEGCQYLRKQYPGLVLAYHDRSDGGLFTTVAEMSFAGRLGFSMTVDQWDDPVTALFNEELGAVFQVRKSDVSTFSKVFAENAFPSSASIHALGTVHVHNETLEISHRGEAVFSSSRAELQKTWADTSFRMQSLRDNAASAQSEYDIITQNHRGIYFDLTFGPPSITPSPAISRPKVAILREQGVNGHPEMAWAFHAAGFEAVDVHMTDILSSRVTLTTFRGLAACGGFSYGDVLGAGKGWANSVLLHDIARKEFSEFFKRTDTFAFGACNGCQFLSHLKSIIPGAEDWPEFKINASERFEARASMVGIADTPQTRASVFLRDMVGSKLPVAVAHGEGRATFSSDQHLQRAEDLGLVAAQYVDSEGQPTEVYPLNPNGSPRGVTGVQTLDGRVLALMPHPERVTTLSANSWYPRKMAASWKGMGPWFQLFQSAREWCSREAEV